MARRPRVHDRAPMTESSSSRTSGWLASGVAALAFAAAYPAAAGATDYCVAPNTSCGGTNVATFEQSLDLADNAPDADRIFLGAATYTAPTTAGYSYSANSSPVEIIGAATTETILTAPPSAFRVLFLNAGAGSSIHDLTIHLPANMAGGANGLWLFEPAQRVRVDEDAVQSQAHTAVAVDGAGSFADGSVRVSTSLANEVGVRIDLGATAPTVERSSVIAATAVAAEAPNVMLDRLTLSATSACVEVTGGSAQVRSSLLLPIGGGTGLEAIDQGATDGSLVADGVTIVGDNSAYTTGADASSLNAAPRSASVVVRNSIIRGVQRSLSRFTASNGSASVTAEYSDYDPSATTELGSGGGALTPLAGALAPGDNVNVDPKFVDPTSDYHLAVGSPLIDAGAPATTQGLDLDGNQLVADGDADGVARRDLGAYELTAAPGGGAAPSGGAVPETGTTAVDSVAPLVAGLRAAPATFAAAVGTHFRFTLSEPARLTFRIQRASHRQHRYVTLGKFTRSRGQGANSLRFRGRIGKRALTRGHYRVVVAASDTAGNGSIPKVARFRIVRG